MIALFFGVQAARVRRHCGSAARRIYYVYTKGKAMITKVQKWGNSLGVRIPKALAEGAHVQAGATVNVDVEDGRLVITPVGKVTYDLATLLKQVTPENIHEEIDFGPPVGKEVW